jgi:hypothetical protein
MKNDFKNGFNVKDLLKSKINSYNRYRNRKIFKMITHR